MYTVSLEKFTEKMEVENLTPDIDMSEIEITQADVNRPALQLTGFFDYFDHHRVQIQFLLPFERGVTGAGQITRPDLPSGPGEEPVDLVVECVRVMIGQPALTVLILAVQVEIDFLVCLVHGSSVSE